MSRIMLDYGLSGHWEADLPSDRLLFQHVGPEPLVDPRAKLCELLQQPLDYPALHQAIVPDDKVVLVLDRGVPSSTEIIAAVWTTILQAGVSPENVTILQPASPTLSRPDDPRAELPDSVRDKVVWKIHDPTANDGVGYLASSAAGERIYLAREILNADFVLPIGRLGYDAMLGRREITSAFYPGLSNPEAFTRSIGQGHSELGPDDERPLRQLINEIAWLSGIQFAIQVLPSAGRGGAAEFLTGNPDSVAKVGREHLDSKWRVTLDGRGETAIVALPRHHEETSWEELGAALNTAQRLIVSGGRIIVLSDLTVAPGPGVEMIRASRSAKAALQPLRKAAPPDVLTASQIASAADWASIYLLSRLDSQIVEETFMTPLECEQDVTRLLETCDGCVVLDAAQYIFGEIEFRENA